MPRGITQLLIELRKGQASAESELAGLVYTELHRMAARYMQQERPGHSLQPTILVHDAYLRLVGDEDRSWENRSHFFAVAARLMRRILIDHARSRNAAKRGGPQANLPLDDALVISEDRMDEVLMVDEALTRLAERDPDLTKIVELRFFAGLTDEEIAEALGISPRTVKRRWQVAKAWLHAELCSDNDKDSGAVGAA
jgi:RNA polymerase sigma factor (TIGR02999 family)